MKTSSKTDDYKIVKSTCGMCFSCCGILVHVKNNRVVKISGDPDSPVNSGTICLKGKSALEMLYHPQRLISPLKRAGARGEGKWKKISWDEALDVTAEKLLAAKVKFGPQSVAFVQGTTKGLIDVYMERLVNAFGSPNIATSGHVCFLPRLFASKATNGFFPVPDYQGNPEYIILWGADFLKTRIGEHKKIIHLQKKGTKIIVIDPATTLMAKKAELHAKILPGTDLVLALGMIHVIIQGQLYDKKFVAEYCTGFDELKIHTADYPLDKVSRLTHISVEKIKRMANIYASAKKAVIQWGNAIEHGVNSFQTARAISILRAITGKIDKEGCDIQPLYPVPGAGMANITLCNKMTDNIWEKRLHRGKPMLPWFKRVLPADIVHSLNTADPYKLSCVYIMGANPLLTFSNVKNAEKAFKNADFIAVSDRFMTPTALLADIILPPSTFLEYDSIIAPPYYAQAGIQRKVVDTKGSFSDYDITTRLAEKLGLGDDFYPDMSRFFDLVLKPSGMTFKAFKRLGTLSGKRKEKKYIENGFQTPSGKVELYSKLLEDSGFSPLPSYIETHEPLEQYPVVLTCGKSSFFRHSDNRQLPTLRNAHPEPVVKINPVTAKIFHIKDKDSVCIETANGKIVQKAMITKDILPGVVSADFGWWFPEEKTGDNTWKTSNLNILTSDSPPFSPETGSVNFRGIMCNIKSVEI